MTMYLPRNSLTALVLLLCVLTGRGAAAPGDLLFTIKSPNPQPGANFGYRLAAMDGDILVGAFTEDLGLPFDAQGRAYLFDGETGKHTQTFDLPDPMDLDLFASSLAGGDGRVFISARGVLSRVHAFDAITGEHLFAIQQPSQFHHSFGADLAYGEGNVLVSSPAYSAMGLISIGRADLFDAVTGQFQRALLNPEPNAGDALGLGPSLAIFDGQAIVGAQLDDFPDDGSIQGRNAGRVWVFDRSTGGTVFTLENPRPETLPPNFFSDSFGHSVAAGAGIVVVGASDEDTGGIEDSGAAYVFNSNTGELMHTLFSPRLQEGGTFGAAVSVTPGGHVLVGSTSAIVDGIPAGAAYLFDGLTGSLLLDIPNPDPSRFPGFGASFAATNDRIFVGAPFDEAVLVFESIPEPSTLYLTGWILTAIFVIRQVRNASGKSLRLRKARGSP
jgi:outer membrane protein assembly factor BamB